MKQAMPQQKQRSRLVAGEGLGHVITTVRLFFRKKPNPNFSSLWHFSLNNLISVIYQLGTDEGLYSFSEIGNEQFNHS